MIEFPTDNVTELPVRKKVTGKNHLSLAPNALSACQHNRTQIDITKAELTCLDCQEKLNPIWFIQRLTTEEGRVYQRLRLMRAEIESLKERSKVKCEHCKKLTSIRTHLTDHKLFALAEQMDGERSW